MIDAKKAFELYIGIKTLEGSYNKYFLFAAESNVDKIEPHFNKYVELEKTYRGDSDISSYERGVRSLTDEYCEKDDEGQPVIENGYIKIPNDKIDEFNKMIEEYTNLNKEIIEKIDGLKKAMNDLISSELDIELELVELSNFPDFLDVKVFNQIKIMRK